MFSSCLTAGRPLARAIAIVAFACLFALAGSILPARAADLTIGTRYSFTPDPHYLSSSATYSFYRNYYATLMDRANNGRPIPGLAKSYTVSSDGLTWDFHLRGGLKFSNGAPIVANDVVCSFLRARDMPNAAGSYAYFFSGITSMSAPDEKTVRIVTKAPVPALLGNVGGIPVIPSSVCKANDRAAFATAAGSISSGPYKFVSYVPGEKVVLERNPYYYGTPARWDHVTFRLIPDNAARTAALLGGDVDVIDGVAPQDVARIRSDGRFTVVSGPSDRSIFLAPDVQPGPSPFVTGPHGEPLKVNPLHDPRVREALTLAINRNAIRDHIMDGFSYPTGELTPKAIGGYNDTIPVPPYDPALAKKLLAEAGYPDGFSITMHCPNDRYVNDARICQAAGQMFARIGVKANVQIMPTSVFFPLITSKTGVSLFLFSWGSTAGETSIMWSMFHPKTQSFGSWNLTHYDDPQVTAVTEEAFREMDRAKRYALIGKAMKMVMDVYGAIPIHDQSVIMASKKGLDVTINPTELTLAENIKPAGAK